MPNKEQRLNYDGRAREIVAKMSLKEKIILMSGNSMKEMVTDMMSKKRGYNFHPWCAGGNDRLNVPKMAFCDGPRGVVTGTSTCFPVSMARGASFDTELEERVGDVIGREVRAVGGNYYGGVCINLPYNPGWGRSQEVYGEDSMHLGKMGVALTSGVQRHNVIACIKHYAFNSMECKRFSVSVKASKRTEREIYLRHFKQCIDAGAASVMGAYNKYEGKHCCHNEYLLRDVLKKEWDFDGFVISDFIWGVRDTEGGINGGCDVEMCLKNKYSVGKVMKLVKKGVIKEETINDSAIRIVRTLLAFTESKDPQKYPIELCQCDEHVALAEEVADKSITLIKNNGILPLKASKIVLVGDLAKVQNIGDHGSSNLIRANADTIYDRFAEKLGDKMTFVQTDQLLENENTIKAADAVVAVVGLGHSDEGEFVSEITNIGGDRKKGLGLHDKDVALLQGLGKLNDKVTAVLIGGNMLMLDPWYDSVNAIVMAYYPGMRGGKAVTDLLFGDVNPSGKTPFVTPYKESDLPQIDWDAEEQYYDYYHGYAKLDKEKVKARIPYGFGLSYTTFELSHQRLVSANDKTAVFSVKITNTGKREGGEVAQLYAGWNNSAVDRPVKALMDFQKVYLKAGEEKTIELRVNKADMAYFDEQKNCFIEEDLTYTAFIGNNSEENLIAIDFVFTK